MPYAARMLAGDPPATAIELADPHAQQRTRQATRRRRISERPADDEIDAEPAEGALRSPVRGPIGVPRPRLADADRLRSSSGGSDRTDRVLDVGSRLRRVHQQPRRARALGDGPESRRRGPTCVAGVEMVEQDCARPWPFARPLVRRRVQQQLPGAPPVEGPHLTDPRRGIPHRCARAVASSSSARTSASWAGPTGASTTTTSRSPRLPSLRCSVQAASRSMSCTPGSCRTRCRPGATTPTGCSVPYLRLPVAWRILGKQFLVVASRPERQANPARHADGTGPPAVSAADPRGGAVGRRADGRSATRC